MRVVLLSFFLLFFCSVIAQTSDETYNSLLQKANINVGRYYMSEAKKAFEDDDSRLAYLLAKAALIKDKTNTEAQALYDTILPYLSTVLYKDTYVSSDSYYNQRYWSPDNKTFAFLSHTTHRDTLGMLNFIRLDELEEIWSFPNTRMHWFNYTPDSKLLLFSSLIDKISSIEAVQLDDTNKIFSFYNAYSAQTSHNLKYLAFDTKSKDKIGTLNLIQLDRPDKTTTFTNVNNYSYRWGFSKDDKYLFFYSNANDSIGTLNLVPLSNLTKKYSFSNIYRSNTDINDKFITFYTKIKNKNYLNVVDLKNLGKPLSFSNVDIEQNGDGYSYEYSKDSKFLTFFTDVKDSVGTLHIVQVDKPNKHFTFPDVYNQSHTCGYSEDNKYFSCFSDVKNGIGILNVIQLDGFKKIASFSNSLTGEYDSWIDYKYTFKYSADSKYFTFFTNGKNGTNTFNFIKIDNPKKVFTFLEGYLHSESFNTANNTLSFFTHVKDKTGILHIISLSKPEGNNYSIPNSYCDISSYLEEYSYHYCNDNKSIVYCTDLKRKSITEESVKLNIFNFENPNKNFSFPNIYLNSWNSKSISSNKKSLAFVTDIQYYESHYSKPDLSNGIGTLNVIDIDNPNKITSFPNSNIREDEYSYSKDDSLFLFKSGLDNELKIWNLYTAKMENNYFHNNEIIYFSLSKDNRWLITYARSRILKVIDTSLKPEHWRAYYDNLLQFTPDEKTYYGID